MASSPPHSQLLNQAAREMLRPLGLYQSGRSRLWIDDHGWWLIAVSFEPSIYLKGTFLSVAAHWLWHPEPALGVHFGGRLRPSTGLLRRQRGVEFFEFHSVDQFAPVARRLATVAADKVREYRASFPTLASVPAVLQNQRDELFPQDYNIAVAYGLLGQPLAARAFFDRARIKNPSLDWHMAENEGIDQLCGVLDDTVAFRCRVSHIIDAQREIFKLDSTRVVDLPGPTMGA
jgi:hypothetical protein